MINLQTLKKPAKLHFFLLIFCLFFGFIDVFGQSRIITTINDSWKFKLYDDPNAYKPGYDDGSWGVISLPHTWNNLDGQDGGHNYFRGIGWYRKSFYLGNITGKCIFLKFNSANLRADVYVNGVFAGYHIGGYAAFIFDVTKLVLPGQNNLIAVKVSNDASLKYAPLSGDFNFCGGITRSVELWVTGNILVSPLDYASPGVYITPQNITKSKADINVKVLLANNSAANASITELYNIKDANNNVVNSYTTSSTLPSQTVTTVSRNLSVTNPVFWQGLKNPYLYSLEISLKLNGTEIDRFTQKFGIRTLDAKADSGFYLNGKRYPLYGVAFHEDRKDKGRAISDIDRKQDLDMLKETGLDYIRLAHYQHGQYTYNYCDSTGIIISTEIPFVEKMDTTSSGFSDNIKEQLKELIKQNYNHPSVCFWGLYNEIFLSEHPDPTQLVSALNSLAKSLDQTRLTTAASIVNDKPTNWIPDLISFNRYYGWYYDSIPVLKSFLDGRHGSHPNNKIGLSEYGAGASINQHEETPLQPVPDGHFHPEEYQSYLHETSWKAIKDRPFLWSTSIWVGIDFASDTREEGDANGINDKGLITYDRLVKKDAYYFYKANWSSSPVVYITSRRYINRTQANTNIKVYSNSDSVELFINNRSYGFKKTLDHVFIWKNVVLDYGSDKLKANGIKNGVITRDSCTLSCSALQTSIALNKPATCQTSQTGHEPYKANDSDGTNNSYWSADPYSQWWMVDLGDNYTVTSVVIRNYVDGVRYYRYNIQASSDNVTFITIAEKTNTNKATDAGDTYTVNATARYLKVNMLYNSANTGIHITDFKAFGILSGGPVTYTITASAGTGGTISPSGAVTVNQGASKTFTVTPNIGYMISGILVDNVSVGTPSSYTFNSVSANHAIAASFALLSSSIALNKPATCQTSQTGHESYKANDSDGTNNSYWSADPYSQWWMVDLGNNYNVTSVVIRNYFDGVRYYRYNIQASTDNVTFITIAEKTNTNIATDAGDTYTVNATARYLKVNMLYNSANTGIHITDFKAFGILSGGPVTYTITASAGTGGTISPSGAVTVNQGASKTFTVTPNSGYMISDVLVDNVSVGTPSSYTFNSVSANHTIAASFALLSSSIALNKPATCQTSQTGHESYKANDSDGTNNSYWSADPYSQWWMVDLGNNYNVTSLVIRNYFDGVRYYRYNIQSSTDNVTFITIAEKTNNNIAADAGDTYTVNATARYLKVNMLYNSANTGIHITDFKAFGILSGGPVTYTITASAGTGGTISPSGAVTVNQGASKTFTVTPNNGYMISDVLVDNVSVGAPSSYTFNSVSANHAIAASFALLSSSIALNKPATCQTSQTGHEPYKANDSDGTNNSYWSADPYSQWWIVDLGDNYNVTSVVIRNYVDGVRYYRYNIQASTDNVTFITIAEKTNTNIAADAGDTYTVNATARYLKVNMLYNSANKGIHITDFKAFGIRVGGTGILKTTEGTGTGDTINSSPGNDTTDFSAGELMVYPVPSKDGRIIVSISTAENYKIELFSPYGVLIRVISVNNSGLQSLDLDSYKGLYFLRITAGNKQGIRKIILY